MDRRNHHFTTAHHLTPTGHYNPRLTRRQRVMQITLETTLGVLSLTLWLFILGFIWTATP